MVRILRVNFRAGVAGELLPDFLTHARVRHCRVEGMPQAVKRETRARPQAFMGNFTLDARPLHNRHKPPAQAVLAACPPARKGRKQKRLADARPFQKLALQIRVQRDGDGLFCFAWGEADKLTL